MSKHDHVETTVFTMPLSELEKRVAKAKTLFAELHATLPGLEPMTDDERLHSKGKLRDHEDDALRSVARTVRLAPQTYAALADQDEGFDPKTFEVDLLVERLDRRKMLATIADDAARVGLAVGDAQLELGELAAEPLRAAYRIAKTLAETDPRVRDAVAPAVDFYGRVGRAAARTRAAKKPKPAV